MDNKNISDEMMDRRVELSFKFLKFGEALSKEGEESGDDCISMGASIMFLLAGGILKEDDMKDISFLGKIYSSAKVLASMEDNGTFTNDFNSKDIIKKIMEILPKIQDNENDEDDEDFNEDFGDEDLDN